MRPAPTAAMAMGRHHTTHYHGMRGWKVGCLPAPRDWLHLRSLPLTAGHRVQPRTPWAGRMSL